VSERDPYAGRMPRDREARIKLRVLPDADDPVREAHVDRVLLDEMAVQCDVAGVAWRRLEAELRRGAPRKETVWADIHSLLSASSSLSLFLEDARHGPALKSATDTGADSVLLERTVRNSVVHFDERLRDTLNDPRATQIVTRHLSSVAENLGRHTDDAAARLPQMTLLLLQRAPLRVTVASRDVTGEPASLNLEELVAEVARVRRVISHVFAEPLPPTYYAQEVRIQVRKE